MKESVLVEGYKVYHNTIIKWYGVKKDEEEGHFYYKPIRPELAAFALEMETVLRENDHKSGWDTMSVHQLFSRIKDEFEELQREYTLQTNALDGINRRDRLRKEAIDLANFCMFLAYWTHKED